MINHPFWRLGFRPFFSFGIVYSLILVLFWMGIQTGQLSWGYAYNPITWHGHEMIYGFATAVIAGFILTASQNWSGVRGIHGRSLMGLVGVWLLARCFAWIAPDSVLFPIFDLLFYPMLAWSLKPQLGVPSQKKNWIFFILFFLLFSANLVFHLSKEFQLHLELKSLHFSIYTIVGIVALVAGRVIPFFTQRALNRLSVDPLPFLEPILVPSIIAFAIGFLFFPENNGIGVLGLLCGAMFIIRFLVWKPWRSFRIPILWILYVGYLFIPVGFILSGWSALFGLPPSFGAHAFGFGVIGIFIYGMISRVALGHTGRPIRASRLILVGYLMMTLGAFIRVFGALLMPERWTSMIGLAGTLWILAYLFLAYQYLPILFQTRVDGAEG